MPNSEDKKRPLGRVETARKRKLKSEYTEMNAAGVETMEVRDSTQEEKYRMLVQNIPCAAYSAYPGKAGPTTFISNKWKDWTGYSPEELYRDPELWPECIHPDDREEAANTYVRACRDKTPYNLQYRIIHKDTGQVHYVRDQGLLGKDEKGTAIRVDGIVTDITELKKSVNELEQYRDYLEKSVKERTTELQQASEALQSQIAKRIKAEETFRHAFDNANIGMCLVDIEGSIMKVNNQMCEIFGYGPEELQRMNVNDIAHPEDVDISPDFIKRSVSGEIESLKFEKRYIHRDGHVVWGQISSSLVRDSNGEPLYFISHVQDITDRKRAEEALRIREQKLRALLNAPTESAILVDTEGTILDINRIAAQRLGKSAKSLIGMSIYDYLPTDIAEYRQARGYEVVRSGKPVRFQDQRGGSYYDTNIYPVFDDDGKVSALAVFSGDITVRKKAERALRESEERLKILFESAPDTIYLIDSEGRFVDGNRAAMELIGFAKDEVIGKSLAEMGLLSAGQLSKAKTNLKKVATGKLSGPNEYALKRKDGTHISVEVRTFPVKIGGKMLTLGIARDITEYKRTEKELLEHQAKLKSLASQLSLTEERERHRLATELHDQISQSLVISKIKLDQLRKSSTSDEFNKPLEDICNCLGQIIDDTRTLTFDLSYPILYELGFEAAVAEWLTDQIQEKHRIETEFEDDGRQKPLDDDIRVLLFRNVRELLINIIKHAKANKVRVSIRRVKEHINVSVEDDGVGFDPVEVASMATKRAEFGLFSIRERLEQLGGIIEIVSGLGRGSKITMIAPLKYDNSADGAQK